MSIDVPLWPADPASQLVWAHVVLWWMVVNYLTWEDTVVRGSERTEDRVSLRTSIFRIALRILLLVLAIAIAIESRTRVFWLGATVLVLGSLLPAGRPWAARRRRLAEWELGVNTLFLLLTSAQLSLVGTQPAAGRVLIALPFTDRNLTAFLSLAAAIVFLGRGATFVVRGVLEQAGTLPEYAPEGKQQPTAIAAKLKYDSTSDEWHLKGQTRPANRVAPAERSNLVEGNETEKEAIAQVLDRREVGRGRMIGNVERFILLLLALVASYPAVGFLMAAKGFVRAKEFENRNYAEYFLIGTLVSTALALVVGTLLRFAFSDVWPK